MGYSAVPWEFVDDLEYRLLPAVVAKVSRVTSYYLRYSYSSLVAGGGRG